MPPPVALPSFDAVLFDLDGTLADSTDDITHALCRAFEELGHPVDPAVRSLVDGSPLEEIFAAVVPGGTPEQIAAFVHAYRRHYESALTRTTRLYPGVRETLEVLAALRPRLRLAVATTKRPRTARALTDALEITHLFDQVDGSGGTSIAPKPSPDLLLTLCASLEVAPERTLMVGDTLRDIHAGRRAGMRTAAVTYGLGRIEAIHDARPDYVLEEFDELLVILGVHE